MHRYDTENCCSWQTGPHLAFAPVGYASVWVGSAAITVSCKIFGFGCTAVNLYAPSCVIRGHVALFSWRQLIFCLIPLILHLSWYNVLWCATPQMKLLDQLGLELLLYGFSNGQQHLFILENYRHCEVHLNQGQTDLEVPLGTAVPSPACDTLAQQKTEQITSSFFFYRKAKWPCTIDSQFANAVESAHSRFSCPFTAQLSHSPY